MCTVDGCRFGTRLPLRVAPLFTIERCTLVVNRESSHGMNSPQTEPYYPWFWCSVKVCISGRGKAHPLPLGVSPTGPIDRRKNSKELSDWSGRVRCCTKWAAAAVRVDRSLIGACLGEPVWEFDPRAVRNNIGDTQPLVVLRGSRLRDFPYLHAWLVADFMNGDETWRNPRNGSIESWTGVCR
jgi:hypothetical protein